MSALQTLNVMVHSYLAGTNLAALLEKHDIDPSDVLWYVVLDEELWAMDTFDDLVERFGIDPEYTGASVLNANYGFVPHYQVPERGTPTATVLVIPISHLPRWGLDADTTPIDSVIAMQPATMAA